MTVKITPLPTTKGIRVLTIDGQKINLNGDKQEPLVLTDAQFRQVAHVLNPLNNVRYRIESGEAAEADQKVLDDIDTLVSGDEDQEPDSGPVGERDDDPRSPDNDVAGGAEDPQPVGDPNLEPVGEGDDDPMAKPPQPAEGTATESGTPRRRILPKVFSKTTSKSKT